MNGEYEGTEACQSPSRRQATHGVHSVNVFKRCLDKYPSTMPVNEFKRCLDKNPSTTMPDEQHIAVYTAQRIADSNSILDMAMTVNTPYTLQVAVHGATDSGGSNSIAMVD